jgi:aminopeptidase N
LSGTRVSDKSSLLLIGTHDEIDSMLRKLNLTRPKELHNQGTAQVWATKTSRATVAIVVSVKDAAALQALMRPLPHYGGHSYLIFDGARAIEKGVWPTVPLTYRIN